VDVVAGIAIADDSDAACDGGVRWREQQHVHAVRKFGYLHGERASSIDGHRNPAGHQSERWIHSHGAIPLASPRNTFDNCGM
jgi:hypothetical protein